MIQGDHSSLIATDAKPITPGDGDVDLTILWPNQPYARALYNGSATAADIKITTYAGSTLTYKNVAPGGHLYGLFVKVFQTGTTATNMIAEK